MQELQPRPRPRAVRGATNGGPRNESVDPVDRSELLRRPSQRFPFLVGEDALDGIRLRRERRVFGSFSGIPRLARRSDR
jgi:hypothetical protein